jgi:hypothetical protein
MKPQRKIVVSQNRLLKIARKSRIDMYNTFNVTNVTEMKQQIMSLEYSFFERKCSRPDQTAATLPFCFFAKFLGV